MAVRTRIAIALSALLSCSILATLVLVACGEDEVHSVNSTLQYPLISPEDVNEEVCSDAGGGNTCEAIADDCRDEDRDCEYWANREPSECELNSEFMLSACRLSCGACSPRNGDNDETPIDYGKSFGEPQFLTGDDEISARDIIERIAETQKYMDELKKSGSVDPKILKSCRNIDGDCSYWSLIGECEANFGFMQLKCGPACLSCDMLSIEKRCPMDRETIGPDVWSPGDLNKMFHRLTSEPYKSKYEVNILSSPEGDDPGPWVLTMENFLNDAEAERLIELGGISGYERSSGVGELEADGVAKEIVTKIRTSWNTWCSEDCLEDETVEAVNKRISDVTQIPLKNSEDLQLLRYYPGQFYKSHHDYIDYEVNRQGGVRLITVYLYLNDVKAGGGTNFPNLGLTVMPKRGRVLIWPHVFDSDVHSMDERTTHQALPVKAGVK